MDPSSSGSNEHATLAKRKRPLTINGVSPPGHASASSAGHHLPTIPDDTHSPSASDASDTPREELLLHYPRLPPVKTALPKTALPKTALPESALPTSTSGPKAPNGHSSHSASLASISIMMPPQQNDRSAAPQQEWQGGGRQGQGRFRRWLAKVREALHATHELLTSWDSDKEDDSAAQMSREPSFADSLHSLQAVGSGITRSPPTPPKRLSGGDSVKNGPAIDGGKGGRRGSLLPSWGGGVSWFYSDSGRTKRTQPSTNSQEASSQEGRKWGWFGPVLNPRSRAIQSWNRVFLVACVMAMAVDPLFFYLVAVSPDLHCLYIQGSFAIVVTVLRGITDLIYLIHMRLQFQLAYISRPSLVLGQGELVSDPAKIALKYLLHRGGFFADIFTLIPIPQVSIFLILPYFLRSSSYTDRLTKFLLLATLAQYLPKLLRIIKVVQNMQGTNGYIFGTANSGFVLNFGAYIVAAHVVGACWYLFALQRVQHCLGLVCRLTPGCTPKLLGCPSPILYSGQSQVALDPLRQAWSRNSTVSSTCLDPLSFSAASSSSPSFSFPYGIFATAVPLTTELSAPKKVVFPIFWGLMSLSTFGNAMNPSTYLWEVVFSIFVICSGLILFSMLIGNVQMFLISFGKRVVEMTQRRRDLDFWMRRRQLPVRMRSRVRQSERQRWAGTRGINETEMVNEFPEGLRRDIKRHLCLDLVRKVPLFEHMDDLLLDNICERLRPIMFIEGSQVIREGDPVSRMLFIMRGHMCVSVVLSGNRVASCVLGPGNFSGEELLTWCLGRRADRTRLPVSNTRLSTLDAVEGFALAAEDLVYVTQHFRSRLQGKKLKRAVRHYSPHWRTWAAVTLQLAWRRYKLKKIAADSVDESAVGASTTPVLTRPRVSFINDQHPVVDEAGRDKDRLRIYTAMFMSPKPQDL